MRTPHKIGKALLLPSSRTRCAQIYVIERSNFLKKPYFWHNLIPNEPNIKNILLSGLVIKGLNNKRNDSGKGKGTSYPFSTELSYKL